uniref:Uncharacterized protein n=1 Tax=Rhabditophanes sp. KR3021 TaxID=114890 RepID=A0AC35TW65_9BILA
MSNINLSNVASSNFEEEFYNDMFASLGTTYPSTEQTVKEKKVYTAEESELILGNYFKYTQKIEEDLEEMKMKVIILQSKIKAKNVIKCRSCNNISGKFGVNLKVVKKCNLLKSAGILSMTFTSIRSLVEYLYENRLDTDQSGNTVLPSFGSFHQALSLL